MKNALVPGIVFSLALLGLSNMWNRPPARVNSFDQVRHSARMEGELSHCNGATCLFTLPSGDSQRLSMTPPRLAGGHGELLVGNQDGYWTGTSFRQIHEPNLVGEVIKVYEGSDKLALADVLHDGERIVLAVPYTCLKGQMAYRVGPKNECRRR